QAGDFLDQVHLAGHVGAPARDLDREPPVFRRHEEAHASEQALNLRALYRHAEEMVDALGTEEDRALLLRLGPEVERWRAHLAPRHGNDQLDRPPQRIRHPELVDPALEAVTRLARQLQRPAGTADAGRLKVGALEHEIPRVGAHFRLGAPHDARDDGGVLGIADRGHVGGERTRHAVQGDDLFAGTRASHDDRGAAQPGEIEGVERLVQLEQDVVGRIDDVVDRPLAHGTEAVGEPGGTGPYLDSSDHGGHVSRSALRILQANVDAVHHTCGGLAEGGTGGRSGGPAVRRSARYCGELDHRTDRRAQLAGDPLVAQQIGAVRRHVDHDLVIGDSQRVDEARSRGGRGVELQDARMVGAEPELFRGAQHAVRLDAADLLALELQPPGQYGAHRGVRVDLAGL